MIMNQHLCSRDKPISAQSSGVDADCSRYILINHMMNPFSFPIPFFAFVMIFGKTVKDPYTPVDVLVM